ncbi:type III secretion system translocon subunit SctE [Erwinia piriflorinigrans]|uniref:Cell invasion protein SipB n=1 Tax=Erwinia piriflorinigrans CFBP 5888 TaxID=1161919 RepID=V5Z6X6_9GAMM|nr:type III secretion system translocon subunit SctE [Erwinia piriflorinigrans]CCG87076.1 Cell invasion protein SipB [Erwinia piriflorinigrans CFBP 5888]
MKIPLDSSDDPFHLSGGLEASGEELKKGVNRLYRFANPALREDPRVDKVREALKLLQPEQLSHVLEKAGNALYGNGSSVSLDRQKKPELATPFHLQRIENTMAPRLATVQEAENHYSSFAEMTALLRTVSQLVADSTQEKMMSKLQAYNAMIGGATLSYKNLAADIETQGLDWSTHSDSLSVARTHAAVLKSETVNAQSILDDAQHLLNDLRTQAETQDPISPTLQEKLLAADNRVIATQSNLNSMMLNYQKYVTTVLDPVVKLESLSRSALNSTIEQAKSLIGSLTAQQQNVIRNRHQENEEEVKSLTFLIALMSKLINQNAGEDLKATALLKQQLSEAAAKDAVKQAQEYEKQVRKSEELQQTMGCIGKILGWVITVVSVAAAAFTGGASLVFATVGLALMLGDEINQAVNGHSFLQEAMQPIMESIIQPLMNIFADAFTEVVSIFGADKAAAEMAGQIMAAIAVATLMIAGVMLAGIGIGKVSGLLMEKISNGVAGASLRKIMDGAAGQVFKRATQGLSRSLNVDEITIARTSTYSQATITGAGMVNTVVKSAGDIVAADMLIIAAQAQAKMMKDSAMQDLLDSLMSQATDAFSLRLNMVKKIIENMAAVAENQMQAGKFILNKMSHVAG